MKYLFIILIVPFLLKAQEEVDYNFIGWTIDNKVIYQESAYWMEVSETRIIVQDLITDNIDDYLSIFYSTEFGSGCVISNKSMSIIDTLYTDERTDSIKRELYVEIFLNQYNINKQSIVVTGCSSPSA